MKYLILTIIVTFGILTENAFAQSNENPVDSLFFIESFLDSTILSEIDKLHIPGAVVTIVKHGNIVYNKGYGFADIESKRAVNEEKSIFRMASISKPFTAIAIMKLVEEGKLKLHEDIRPLISDRYEFDWKYPLTIHHILTHTTGLDYSSIGSHKTDGEISDSKNKIKMLDQGHKPGDHFGYSNVAFGLLGYLIEKESGLPYHQYMKENILDPLKMFNSTFNTTLPLTSKAHKAETYYWSNGKNHKQPRQHLGVPAASSLESTGTDMAKFMQAVLKPSTFEELGIISAESFQKMTSPQLPEVTNNSIGYSFFLGSNKNNPSIYHSGGVRGFLSIYSIFPSENLGIFIAQNNRKGAEYFAWSLNSKLYEKLLPNSKADLSWVKNQDERTIDMSKFGGTYRQPFQRNSTFEKGERLLQNIEIQIDILDDTNLFVFGRKFKRIANTTFIEAKENSDWVLQFRLDENDQIERFVNNTNSYKKLKWYKKIIYTQIIVGFSLLIFLFGLIQSFRHLFFKSKSKIPHFQKWTNYIGNGYLLSFSALLAAYFIIETVKEGVPLGFKIPIIILTICGIVSLAFPWAIYENFKSDLPRKSKWWNYLNIISIIAIGCIFYNLNLIGMKW